MAAPHVAALAALVKGRNPGLTPDQVEQAITSTAVDRGTPGRDDDFGAGRIDAEATMAAVTPPSTAVTPPNSVPAMTPPASTPSVLPTPSTPAPTTAVPTTPAPTKPAPSTPASTQPTPGTPAPTQPAPTTPAPSEPAAVQPTVRLVRPVTGQLIVAVIGAAGKPVEVQRELDGQWVTVLAYPATPVTRLTGLTPGLFHRVVVAGVVTEAIRL